MQRGGSADTPKALLAAMLVVCLARAPSADCFVLASGAGPACRHGGIAVRERAGAGQLRPSAGTARSESVPSLSARRGGLDGAGWGRVSRQQVLLEAPRVLTAALVTLHTGVQEAVAAKSSATQAIQADYDRFSEKYDELDGGAAADALGIEQARADMLGSANGRVLEVAVGTGLNLPKYKFRQVSKLVAIDLSPGMLVQAKAKASALALDGAQIEFATMDVENLEFPDASFDTVVDTFSLCVFPDPVAALKEMRRVCKPGGRILLLENSVSDNAVLAAYQKATAPLVAKVGGKGCFYDQDPAALAAAAGLRVVLNRALVAGGVLRQLEARVDGKD